MPFLHDLLTAQARTDQDGTAALHGDATLTFGHAEAGADRIAAGLVLLGARPGSRVGLHLSRSLNLWPALFGLLRAGAVCVPVDPEDPDERRRTILEFSGARIVLTERALLSSPCPPGVRAVAVEDLLAGAPAPLTAPVPLADDALAFVFYTSGSTGVPKGVMLTHRALLSGQQWLQRTFPLQRGERHLLRTTLSITNLVREVFWPMLSGGTAVVVPPGEHKDPDRLVEWIDTARVTTLMVVPALLSGMMRTRFRVHHLAAVRLLQQRRDARNPPGGVLLHRAESPAVQRLRPHRGAVRRLLGMPAWTPPTTGSCRSAGPPNSPC